MGRNRLFILDVVQFYPASEISRMQHPSGGNATLLADGPVAIIKQLGLAQLAIEDFQGI